MRSINFSFIVFISLILLACGGSQKLESEDFNSKSVQIDEFTSITVTQGIEVVLYQSNEHKANISSNYTEYLRLDVDDDGTLLVHFDKPAKSIFTNNKTKVEIWANNVNTFKASSSGLLNVKGKFNDEKQAIHVSSSASVFYDVDCKNLTIDVSSSGEFKGKITAYNLNASSSSSGEMQLAGKSKMARLEASSSGDINAKKLDADFVTADVSSGGDIYISVKKELTANASSGGDLFYNAKGKIEMNINKSSGGNVKPMKGSF